jgi:RNA polymerase sigma factor (sigma-70 family)
MRNEPVGTSRTWHRLTHCARLAQTVCLRIYPALCGICCSSSVMKTTDYDWLSKMHSESAEGVAATDTQGQFSRRFEACRTNLLAICRKILSDADGANDAVQETYLRAYGNLARFEEGNFPGWLSRIAQRVCIDRIRADFPCRPLNPSRELSTTHDEMRLLNKIQIRSILSRLPDQQRRCLKLFYIEGFSAKEVARETGFKENQVKSYLQNGRRRFMIEWEALDAKRHE